MSLNNNWISVYFASKKISKKKVLMINQFVFEDLNNRRQIHLFDFQSQQDIHVNLYLCLSGQSYQILYFKTSEI